MATDDITIPQHVGISEAPRDIEAIKKQEKAALLPHWDSGIAFKLGYNLRTRLLTFERPAVVNISTISTPGHVLFHAVTHSGTALDNDFWVSRKRAAVIRFNASTWRLQNQFEGDEEKFKAKMGLGETAKDYAIHGGGVPIYIKNCDSPVAVVVVSGLKQWDDHQVVIEELGKLCKEMENGHVGTPI
ncbi:alcohol dehydrogenase, propanol-preferring [Alternaria panax]|uniref:Alcohol dehydrogenase, propanol-preferring n=1 Tax=Alternaria panax TaxID=48097 RepID=A0AAD4IDM4_9PLEO|nr:alcohol dehydrogenase, propanol-preferring [Alternaria panax]